MCLNGHFMPCDDYFQGVLMILQKILSLFAPLLMFGAVFGMALLLLVAFGLPLRAFGFLFGITGRKPATDSKDK